MKGMIDYLTGPSTGAQVLRKHFLFKVVPMLNPDGVINGNTRVNLAGWDLNRKWSYPVEKLFPTVFHLKRQIANLQARDRVAIYCDLHGHSLNRNIFTYGCYTKKSSKRAAAAFASMGVGASSSSLNLGSGSLSNSNTQTANVISRASVRNDPRVFPMIVAKNSHFFSFASCDFKVHKSKLNTARVVVNHELGVINSYTLEASFCGPDFGPRKDTQFSTRDLEDMGKSWCQSLLIYFDLVADVKALDAQREQELALTLCNQKQAVGPDGKLVVNTTTTTVEMTSSLLSDCEAAISELFANTEVEYDDDAADVVSMDSDLSGAEDEPIPPNQQANGSGSDVFLFDRIPGEAGDGVTVAVGGDDDVVECYSSAPEDGDEHQSPEKADGGSRRRKSRNSRKKVVKKSDSGSSGKRSKTKSKKDKAKVKNKASTGDQGAVVTLADEDPSVLVEPSTGKKKASKLRRKSKSGSKKGRSRSRSIHGSGVKQKPHAGSGDDSECDGDEAEEVDDEDDLLTLPLTSARVCPSDGLVLPSMPGSADRRRLQPALLSANDNHTLRHDGGKADEVDDAIEDQLAPDNRRFLYPTPPSQRGRAKLIRTASPSPIELPVLRGSEAPPRRGGFKEKIMEAYGLTGRHGNGNGYADNSDNDEASEVGEGDRGEDSDASGPEAYLSEF